MHAPDNRSTVAFWCESSRDESTENVKVFELKTAGPAQTECSSPILRSKSKSIYKLPILLLETKCAVDQNSYSILQGKVCTDSLLGTSTLSMVDGYSRYLQDKLATRDSNVCIFVTIQLVPINLWAIYSQDLIWNIPWHNYRDIIYY